MFNKDGVFFLFAGTLSSTGPTYVSNPASVGGYNTSTYNSLGQHYSTPSKALMGTSGIASMGHHSIGMGTSGIGQQSVLGTYRINDMIVV